MPDLDLSLGASEGQPHLSADHGTPADEDPTNGPAEVPTDGSGNAVGERLRHIRHQQGLSLADVEARTDGAWKAVVVGAYERGDRAVTISRLAELAEVYGVPLSSLLPGRAGTPPEVDDEPRRREADDGQRRLKLDLERLDEADREELDPIALQAVARFAEHIQLRRGDHNGRVLTVRGDDLRTIAVAIGHDPSRLIESLRDQGAVVQD
ncbi:MAG: transcriptional regulator [Ilumatobacteraceae bacterium]